MRAVEGIRSVDARASVLLVGAEMHLPYERPPLSKGVLADVSAATVCIKHEPTFYVAAGVELALGDAAVRIDCVGRKVELASGRLVSYAKLVLSTGSRPRRLALPVDPDRVFYLRTLDDAKRLSARLTNGTRLGIIGAGFIGLEVAAAARDRACRVTVFETASHILTRALPASVAVMVQRFHEARGVEFVLGAPPANDRASHFDALVVGIGVVPNKEMAAAAGIATADGILVNACGRTSDADVLAAGEVTQHPIAGTTERVRRESWQVAESQAFNAGRTAAGAPTQTLDVPWFWSDQSNLNLQVLGQVSPASELLWRGDFARGSCSAFVLEERRVIGVVALNAARDISAGRRLIASGAPVSVEGLRNPACSLRDVIAG